MKRYFCLRDCYVNGKYFRGKLFYDEDELHGPPNHHFQLVEPAAADNPEVQKVVDELTEEAEDILKDENVHPSLKKKAKSMKEAVEVLTSGRRREKKKAEPAITLRDPDEE